MPERIRRYIFRNEPLCRQCSMEGRYTIAVEIDHILPLYEGGSNKVENLQPLCYSCHTMKTSLEKSSRMKAYNEKT